MHKPGCFLQSVPSEVVEAMRPAAFVPTQDGGRCTASQCHDPRSSQLRELLGSQARFPAGGWWEGVEAFPTLCSPQFRQEMACLFNLFLIAAEAWSDSAVLAGLLYLGMQTMLTPSLVVEIAKSVGEYGGWGCLFRFTVNQ
jgi:hypothetical protein